LTVLYAAALTSDVIVHHWTDALEASQDAVPAVIGWAALIYVFFKDGTPAAEQMLSVDNVAVQRAEKQAEEDRGAVEHAEKSVRRLTERLACAVARRDAAGADARPGLDQEVTEIESHLEEARRSLVSSRDAAVRPRRLRRRPGWPTTSRTRGRHRKARPGSSAAPGRLTGWP
jgi:hypothetical protein